MSSPASDWASSRAFARKAAGVAVAGVRSAAWMAWDWKRNRVLNPMHNSNASRIMELD